MHVTVQPENVSWTKISPQPNYLCNTLQKYSIGINFHPCGKGHHRLYNKIINTGQKKTKNKKKTHGMRVSPMRARGKKRQKFSPGKNSGYTILCYWSSSFFCLILQYDPACAISFSDTGATPSEGDRSSDATPTPTNGQSFSSGVYASLLSRVCTKGREGGGVHCGGFMMCSIILSIFVHVVFLWFYWKESEEIEGIFQL